MNIKNYLKYYIGCDVIVDGEHRGKFIGADLVPNSVDQIYYTIEIDGEDEDSLNAPYNDDSSEDCRLQPILRRIESLSEEEMKELVLFAYMVRNTLSSVSLSCNGIDFTTTGFGFNGRIGFSQLNCEQFHYLLSLGIDLFGLLDAGLAIDAATINQQTEGK